MNNPLFQPHEFELNGTQYKIERMSAATQFHVIRRLGPLTVGLLEGAEQKPQVSALKAAASQEEGAQAEPKSLLSLARTLSPMMAALAKMPDADVNYILDECMSLCYRKDGDRYQKVRTSSGAFLYADIDMKVMLRIVVESLNFNTDGFFEGLLGEIV